jgi:hypothetical protein
MEFTNAYILGVQRRNDYFGDRTAQYRSVDTISVEGYIDVRASNSDFKGVRQALAAIDSYVTAASSSSAVCENIIINGTGFGTGRLVDIDFPASSAIDENQILYGKYSANLEVYHSGNLRNSLEGATVPNPEYLESLSEDFSISLSKENIYELTHSLDITYTSGVNSDGSVLDPIGTAKTLATNLFDQTPTQFSTVIPDSYGSISVASRKYFTESYNLMEGSCTFEKKFSLLPSGMTNYSLKVSNDFSFDELGIITVKEQGEISPRSPEFLEEAKSALDSELANSYGRCNTLYNSYKDYLGDNIGSLYNQAITKNKNIDNSAGNSSYDVQYTDNLNIKNITTIEDRTITFNDNNDIVTVTENGTVTSIDSKSTGFSPYALIPSRSAVKSRCVAFYDSISVVGNQYTLKNLNNKFSIPKYGKTIDYAYTFTSDGSVFDRGTDPVFAKKKISHSDKIGTPIQSAVIIPNLNFQILHTPNQTSLGNRGTKIEATLRRAQFTNNLDTRSIPVSAVNTAKTEALQDVYMVFANNNLIRSLDRGQIYATNAAYTFDSNNTFSMSVDAVYSMQRSIGGNLPELNLAFNVSVV